MSELVPRWLIGARTRRGGWRMPKKPLLEKPVMGYGQQFLPEIYRKRGIVERAYDVVTSAFQVPKLNDFDTSELRFWMVDKYKETVITTECRYCGSIMTNSRMRREHIENRGCTKHLVAAYKLLGKDKLCVICDAGTRSEKWGVPLCSNACIEKWCFFTAQPAALKLAIDLL